MNTYIFLKESRIHARLTDSLKAFCGEDVPSTLSHPFGELHNRATTSHWCATCEARMAEQNDLTTAR